MNDVPALEALEALKRQEEELVFTSFDHGDAWRLGSRLAGMAQAAGHAVGIDIRRPGLILFRAALPGITPDQESWIARKSALVLRMEASSALVEARLSSAGIDPVATGWLGADYAVTGARFPFGSAASVWSRRSLRQAFHRRRIMT
ncbi:UPF0303 protein SCO2848 [Arthrobacter sp. Hiyo8]|nr:UPF0303 protein SCO2848 [Arthrobacter sp. Hiyo8]